MRDQPTGGHIFNMDGAGADGGATPRFAACAALALLLRCHWLQAVAASHNACECLGAARSMCIG